MNKPAHKTALGLNMETSLIADNFSINEDYIFYYVIFCRSVKLFHYLSFHKEKLISPRGIPHADKKDWISNLHGIGLGGYSFANYLFPV